MGKDRHCLAGTQESFHDVSFGDLEFDGESITDI